MDIEKIENCRECKNNAKCFQHLCPEELKFINEKKTQLTYLQGETIFKQGAFAPHVLFVVDGLARVYLQTGASRQLNIRLSRSGDFMAFSSVFGEKVHTYSAMAMIDSTICMIEKSAMRELLMQNPDFAMRITSKNFRNENRYLEIIRNVSYKQMRGKLASALLYLSADEFLELDVFKYMTRQDIADFASVTTEVAIKFIKEFEREGIVRLDGRQISILNKDALDEISRRG